MFDHNVIARYTANNMYKQPIVGLYFQMTKYNWLIVQEQVSVTKSLAVATSSADRLNILIKL